MDINPFNIALQGGVSIAAMACFALVKNWKLKKLKGICLPIGKTTLATKLKDSKTFILDLDEYVKEKNPELYEKYKDDEVQYMLNVFSIVVSYIDTLLKHFGNKNLLICSSHYQLLEQLNLKKIYTYLPDENVISKAPMEEKDRMALKMKSLKLTGIARKVYIYSDIPQLYNLVRNKFNIRNLLNV